MEDKPIERITIQEIMDLLGKQTGVLVFIETSVLERIPAYFRNRMVIFYRKDANEHNESSPKT